MRCELTGPIHPLTGEPRLRSQPRTDLFKLQGLSARRRRQIDATYDAARDSDEFKNYWANADSVDADSRRGHDRVATERTEVLFCRSRESLGLGWVYDEVCRLKRLSALQQALAGRN